MKKIIIALAAVCMMASCQKSILYSEHLYDNGIVAFRSSSNGEMSAFLEESGPVTFTFSSSVKVDKDVTVSFEPARDSAAVLGAFNKANGTNYWMLPEANYTLTQKAAVIKAGNAVSDPVTVDVNIDGFKNGVIYCLPLKITGSDSSLGSIPGQEYAYLVIRGYVYASAANLPGSSYFMMDDTVNDPRLQLETCTMEIRVKVNSWAGSNPYISSLIGVEENFLLRFGDISCDPNQLQLAGQGVSITSKAHFDTGKW